MKTAEEMAIQETNDCAKAHGISTRWDDLPIELQYSIVAVMQDYAKQVAEQLLKDVADKVYNAPLHEWEEISKAISQTPIQLP